MKRILEEARRLVRMNSETVNGNEELANYVVTLMKDCGMRTQTQQVTHALEDVSKRQFNVVGIQGDNLVDRKIRKGLLLVSHLDTVSAGLAENWVETAGDPFAAVVKDGKVFGLGAADAKLDFLCKLHAIRHMREAKLKMPVYLVGTCGGEMGMFGAKYLIKSMSLNPRYVVVGSPTSLKLVNAHKLMHVYRVSLGFQQVERDAHGFNRRIDLHVRGLSSHGACPDQGVNAIASAMRFVQTAVESGFDLRFTKFSGGDMVNKVPDQSLIQFYLASHQFEDFKRFFRETTRNNPDSKSSFLVEFGGVGDAGVRFLPEPLYPAQLEVMQAFEDLAARMREATDEAYQPPYSTVNLGLLQQRAGKVDLVFDLRMLPGPRVAEIEKLVQDSIRAIAARYPSINLTVTRDRANPELNTDVSDELLKKCTDAMNAAHIEPVLSKESVSTEAALFAQAGYPVVVFGPGASAGNCHSPNEYNLLGHLEKAVHFYEKLIEKTCL